MRMPLVKNRVLGLGMPDRIITADLMGGIGNQLFQIAAAYAISRELDCTLEFQRNQFSGAGAGSHPSKYYNSIYVSLPIVDNLSLPRQHTISEERWTYYPLVDRVRNIFNRGISCIDIRGYFQSEQYFKKYSSDIKALFTPQEGIIQWIATHTTLFQSFPELKEPHDYGFIGIRRGDYIQKASFHNPCGMDYYEKALAALPREIYYIVTDDYVWAKKHFVGDKFRFLDNITDDLHHLYASTLFKHYIIGNSSFHWWGSFLSIYDNPTIIAPDKWVFGPNVQKEQYWTIYRDNMTVLTRQIESD